MSSGGLFRPERRAAVPAGVEVELLDGPRWASTCGRVIEVVTGDPLDVALRRLVLDPPGMHDTGFHVPEADHDRLAMLYGAAPGSSGR